MVVERDACTHTSADLRSSSGVEVRTSLWYTTDASSTTRRKHLIAETIVFACQTVVALAASGKYLHCFKTDVGRAGLPSPATGRLLDIGGFSTAQVKCFMTAKRSNFDMTQRKVHAHPFDGPILLLLFSKDSPWSHRSRAEVSSSPLYPIAI